MNKKANPLYGMRAKLLSAVSMLLVAVIMVISSTYAWFTLSTAPEVKGISTAIGANGALEMALLKGNGSGGFVDVQNDKAPAEPHLRNYFWGNLVDVSDDDIYGSNSITLLPSKLTLMDDGKINLSSILSTPSYGTDGRVDSVDANTVTGTLSTVAGQGFLQNNDFGFRGVGVASGMTDRELAFRNAKASAGSYMGLATTAAAKSLEANGGSLADIVIKKATAGGDTATYTQTDVAALNAIVDSLLGTNATEVDGVLEYIEQAYVLYVVAYAAGSNAGEGEAWRVLKSEADKGTTLSDIMAKFATEDASIALPTELTTIVDAFNATKQDVADAKTALASLTGDSITWTQLSTPLYLLADVDAMTVNGWTANEIKADQDGFVQQVMNDDMDVKVAMASGGGVYADVADHCGDYTASIVVDVVYGSLKLENVNARMETKSNIKPLSYLSQVANSVNSKGFVADASQNADKPITEFYGYILDLAFRTNAADSDLLLQTAPKDRIYSDNAENNEFTWGGGSTMSFTSTTTSFSTAQMKSLMDHIKVVFFDPTTGEVYVEAKLDTVNAKNTATGVEAALYLIGTDDALITTQADAKIKDLTQNQQTNISVLVYLDGETITNADVAAENAASMTGKLNLQFSSSANLVPTEYGDFHIKGNTTTAESTTAAESN